MPRSETDRSIGELNDNVGARPGDGRLSHWVDRLIAPPASLPGLVRDYAQLPGTTAPGDLPLLNSGFGREEEPPSAAVQTGLVKLVPFDRRILTEQDDLESPRRLQPQPAALAAEGVIALIDEDATPETKVQNRTPALAWHANVAAEVRLPGGVSAAALESRPSVRGNKAASGGGFSLNDAPPLADALGGAPVSTADLDPLREPRQSGRSLNSVSTSRVVGMSAPSRTLSSEHDEDEPDSPGSDTGDTTDFVDPAAGTHSFVSQSGVTLIGSLIDVSVVGALDAVRATLPGIAAGGPLSAEGVLVAGAGGAISAQAEEVLSQLEEAVRNGNPAALFTHAFGRGSVPNGGRPGSPRTNSDGSIRYHTGWDWSQPMGTESMAVEPLRVLTYNQSGGFGIVDIVDCSDRIPLGNIPSESQLAAASYGKDWGVGLVLAHAARFSRPQNSDLRISAGETVHVVGKTGSATGPHIHMSTVRWRTGRTRFYTSYIGGGCDVAILANTLPYISGRY